MFEMIVDCQLNLADRTLLLGVPDYFDIPKNCFFEDKELTIIGVSSGVRPPYLSLEIERIDYSLEGEKIIEK